jgi:hypothetical protein
MRGPNLNLAIDGVRAHWGARSLTTRLTVVAALGALGVGYLISLNPYAQPAHLAVLTRVVIVVTLVLTGIYAQTNRL